LQPAPHQGSLTLLAIALTRWPQFMRGKAGKAKRESLQAAKVVGFVP
jgi:hypothetical protein